MKDVSMVSLMGRLVVSMGVVVALMWGAARLMQKKGIGGIAPKATGKAARGRTRERRVSIEVLARQQLNRTASVAVVNAGGKQLILGVTETQVTVLSAEPEPFIHLDVTDVDDIAVLESAQSALTGGGPRTAASGMGLARPAQTWTTMLEQLKERTVRR